MTKRLSILQPDDWHVHFRDGLFLERTVNDHAALFSRALVMPNLSPPVTTIAAAHDYAARIHDVVNKDSRFRPYMTLYLTEQTTAEQIHALKAEDDIIACKLYPAGVTTGSAHGVRTISQMASVFEAMQETGCVLCIHGEVNDPNVDVFDREAAFIDTILAPLVKQFPALRIVLEHITTKNAVDFVLSQDKNVAATITPQHLALNRNDLLGNGIRPHYFCLPILKRDRHQQALRQVAVSGDKRFFLGSDSAPHTASSKLSACGCAGIYSGYHAIELYTQIFDDMKALDKLENFASRFGAEFYQLPINTETITLIKQDWQVPDALPFGEENVVPMFAGETCHWQVQPAATMPTRSYP